MTITTNRLVQLAITTDPTAALSGTTWSFTGGDLVATVDATMNAEVTGTTGVMQSGDTVDLDGDGTFESVYQGRYNFGVDSTFRLGDGTTITSTLNIIEITTDGVSSYYLLMSDTLASALDTSDLSAVTLGSTMLTLPNTAGLNFDDAATYQLVCFASGAKIQTAAGDKPVQDLQVGELVMTKDNGLQPIRWIGSRKVTGQGAFAPIVFDAGAIGNTRELRLSRQHRVYVEHAMAELYFGSLGILMPACSLVNGINIREQEVGEVEYFHILFDQHELVKSEGTWTESFFLSAETMSRQEQAVQDEILALFLELANRASAYSETARTCLKAWEGEMLSRLMQAA